MNAEHAAFLIGKILLGGYFALSGLNHFTRTRELSNWLKSEGLPRPGLLVRISGLVLIAGGLALIAGAYPVVAITALTGFLFVSAVTLHDFWNAENRQEEMQNFLRNVALIGALLMLLSADWTIYGLGLTLGLI